MYCVAYLQAVRAHLKYFFNNFFVFLFVHNQNLFNHLTTINYYVHVELTFVI